MSDSENSDSDSGGSPAFPQQYQSQSQQYASASARPAAATATTARPQQPAWMSLAQRGLRTTGEASTRALAALFAVPGLSHTSAAWERFTAPFRACPQYSPRGLGQAALTGLALGAVGASALWAAFAWPAYWNIALFVFAMCVFHWCEFMLQGLAHPQDLTTKAFLLSDSVEMKYAVRAAVVEYLLELLLCPGWKLRASTDTTGTLSLLTVLAAAGAAVAAAGQLMRSLAMWEAGASFTHLIQHSKRAEHVLVTSGVYALSRHPSYCGWFFWAVGLQVMLLNPFCAVAYAAVAWKFFDDRIRTEEVPLERFFGQEYRDYRARVPTRIPFIA